MPYSFYLRNDRQNKHGEYPILVSWYVHGVRISSAVGVSVKPEQWNANAAVHIKPGATLSNGMKGAEANARLLALSKNLNDWENSLSPGFKPTTEEMRIQMKRALGDDPEALRSRRDIYDDLREYLNEGINIQGWAYSTKLKYGTLKNHLKQFKENISYSFFTHDGFNEYMLFLQDVKGMQDVSVKREEKMLKAFLKWAYTKGYNTVKDYRDFNFKDRKTDRPVLYLTSEQLIRLYEWEIPKDGEEVEVTDQTGKKKKISVEGHNSLVKVRNIFCFSSFTGLRFSDAMALKKSDVSEDCIRFSTIKTNDPLVVELLPQAKEILDSYSGIEGPNALPSITNQKANEYLKTLFQLFRLDDSVTTIRYIKGKRAVEIQPKWAVMSTHCARRTFIVNALSFGIAPEIVMKWTGHSTYEAMKPYIDIVDSAKSDAMALIGKAYAAAKSQPAGETESQPETEDEDDTLYRF